MVLEVVTVHDDHDCGLSGQSCCVRTYAVKLAHGGRGPEFSSRAEASRWAISHLPSDPSGRIEFVIAYVREGAEVGSCLVIAFDESKPDPTPGA